MNEQTYSMKIDCPSCGKKTDMKEIVKEIPEFGKILITAISCWNCNFKFNDVMNAEYGKPKKWIALIENEKDLNAKIVKSSSAGIQIPELGLEVSPGPLSEGFYSNAEGVLERFKDALNTIIPQLEGKPKQNAEKKLKELIQAQNGSKKFRIILLDAFGNSKMHGAKVKQEKLTEKELKELAKNTEMIETGKEK